MRSTPLPSLATLALTFVLISSTSAQQPNPLKLPPGVRPPARLSGAELNVLARNRTTESEPNNSPATANRITLGDTIDGVIAVPGDFDLFRFEATEGDVLDLEVFAERIGAPGDMQLRLLDSAENLIIGIPDAEGRDPRIRRYARYTGTYFLMVGEEEERGGAEFRYTLAVRIGTPGPGDPVRTIAAGYAWAGAMAAAPNGDIYAFDRLGGGVFRVTADGSRAQFHPASAIGSVLGLAIDGFGDLLVSAVLDEQSTIYRISPSGQRSVFAAWPVGGRAVGIAIGSDGDVWVGDILRQSIVRLTPRGAVRSEVSLGTSRGSDMCLAFSPAGVLHVSDGWEGIYRVVHGAAELVISDEVSRLGCMAFDVDGFLYVGTMWRGVLQYDVDYRIAHEPFAIVGLTFARHVAFGADEAGHYSRLYIAQFDNIAHIAQANPAGVRAHGFRSGIEFMRFASTALRAGVAGTAYADTLRVSSAPGSVTFSLSGGQLPPGVGLEATGAIGGVPLERGAFAFAVRAESGDQFDVRTFTLTVSDTVATMRFPAAELRPAVVGADFADTLRVEDPPGTTIFVVTDGAVPGITLDTAGVFSGFPHDAGAFSVTVRAESAGQFALQTFALTVTNPLVTVDDAAAWLMGGSGLTLALARFLDLQGNRNGRYDPGDFRALLRARGQLP